MSSGWQEAAKSLEPATSRVCLLRSFNFVLPDGWLHSLLLGDPKVHSLPGSQIHLAVPLAPLHAEHVAQVGTRRLSTLHHIAQHA